MKGIQIILAVMALELALIVVLLQIILEEARKR
jgi:hypothetical protein